MTDGGDNQRTGWNRNEKTLTKDNVKNLKLLWKTSDRQPGPRAALADAGARRRAAEHAGGHEAGRLSSAGISDNLYAFDVETGKMLWQKHWDYPPPPAAGGGGGRANEPRIRRTSASSGPAAAATRRSSVRADAQGRRPIYFVTGDGMLHTLNAATGEDLQPPYMFHTGKGWALNLVGNVIWMANTYAGHQHLRGQAGRSAAQGDDLQRRQRRRVGPPRRGDRLDRHRMDHDRRRHLRSDERSAALRQQRRRRAHRRRRAEAEGLLHADATGTGCASAISIRTTRRRSSPTRDAS